MSSRARFLAIVAGAAANPIRVGAQQTDLTTLPSARGCCAGARRPAGS